MASLLSAIIDAVDKSIEKLCDRAFEAAVRAEKAPECELSPQKRLLSSVQAGKATERDPGVKEAVQSGLLTIGEGGSLGLTPLGEYLLPSAEAIQEDASARKKLRDRQPRTPAAA